jgi:hypothetical protein
MFHHHGNAENARSNVEVMDHRSEEERLIAELEAHVRRIIADPKMDSLNVAQARGGLVSALRQYIDKRVKAALDDAARQLGR